MTYLFATSNEDYRDFAAGSVLHNVPGATSFPVRLADEIFQRALSHLKPAARCRVYDPCCGTGYLLMILGLRFGGNIAALYGSDIDARRIEIAKLNLALLTPAGMAARKAQLEAHLAAYGKESHRQALDSLARLTTYLPGQPIETHAFVADALASVTEVRDIDMVITDVPYGDRVAWNADNAAPVQAMLAALHPALKQQAIVAIVTDKSVKVQHDAFRRAERFQIGKRQITLLESLP